jgi:hypothetical protein
MENFNIGDLVTLDDGKNIVEVMEILNVEFGKEKIPYIIIKKNNKLFNEASSKFRLATTKEIKEKKIKNIFNKNEF